MARVAENRKVVQRILDEGRTVYGINTGFGQFATVVIPPAS
jgi:histidine ammonia-lyase